MREDNNNTNSREKQRIKRRGYLPGMANGKLVELEHVHDSVLVIRMVY